MKNLEKSLWFHAHLAFEVIPGTLRCTLIKCLWCVDHTCRGVCSKHSRRGGATVSFGCPGLAGTKLPLCCVQRLAVMTRLERWVEDGYKLFTWFIGGVDFSDVFWGRSLSLWRRPTSLENHESSVRRYSVHHFDWEIKPGSEAQIYEPFSANAAQKKADYLHLQGSLGMSDTSSLL